jgi:hypothetical protein
MHHYTNTLYKMHGNASEHGYKYKTPKPDLLDSE